jgi:hypothetical protein
LGEQGGSGDAINIEISIYTDKLSLEQGTDNPGYCLAHIGEKKGGAPKPLIGSKERLKLSWVFNAPIIKKLSQ